MATAADAAEHVQAARSLFYTVTNEGLNPAQGNWTDAIYLSTNNVWNPDDTLLGYVLENGNIPVGANYTGHLTTFLPGLTGSGSYYIIVRPDVSDSLNENLGANHTGSTSNTFAVDVAQLNLGVPVTNSVTRGQQEYFKVFVPAGQTLSVALGSDQTLSANDLYVQLRAVPTTFDYDFVDNKPEFSESTNHRALHASGLVLHHGGGQPDFPGE